MTETKKFIGFDCLKQTVTIEQVLERYGLLERLHRSGDSLSGSCPIHQGHNPTQFRASISRNCWICFGDCQCGGSIVDFVSRMEGIGIRDAALQLQDWFALNPNDDPPPRPPAKAMPATPTSNPPLRFSLGVLDKNHPYLHQRGLTTDTLAEFGVGVCAHGTLRGWVAIPIHNQHGQVVAHAGRWPGMPSGNIPKYKLPRGFHKSLELFNQHRAMAADPAEPLVVVEGFFGCMGVSQAGHRRVVALMGSMLSKAQEERLVEMAGEHGAVMLLFDGDAAGRKGAIEAYRRLNLRVPVQIVRLADGQQPDDVEPGKLLNLIQASVGEEVAA
jgi:DNA primase